MVLVVPVLLGLEKLSSGAGSEELLLSGSGVKTPSSWSFDAKFLLYGRVGPDNADVWLSLAGDRRPTSLHADDGRRGWLTFGRCDDDRHRERRQ
jgi:hypothetical protein